MSHNQFAGAYRGRRVLVTGHTGFKGSWLCLWLEALGAEVCGYSFDIPTSPALFDSVGLASRIRHEIGDVRDASRFNALVADFQPDFVLHLAAQAIVSSSYREPLETISSNVMGTAVVLDGLRRQARPCTALVVTSDKCYENIEQIWGYREIDPMGGKDVYSASKGAAEIVTRSFYKSFFSAPGSPVRVVSARAGNVIGGGDWAADRIVADCMRAWPAGGVVQLRRPSSTRPWQHVLEPLSGYLALTAAAAQSPSLNGEGFNFGPPAERPRTVLELLGDLARVWGFEDHAAAYEALKEPPFAEAGLLRLNCDKALQMLRWEPTLLYDECVDMTGTWYRDVLKGGADPHTLTLAQIDCYVALATARGRHWTQAAA
ncbi:CDP-glucose 4,6-dehydratase [Rhodovarius lipocyclicus]|uniref:CDP-glucose 4,6-dehydratase n=1 Tax=Rhodovarius lipocyclicus TaxID=268410 RepID=UPI001F22198A|nr:CDP-glucose 4,6-dehydratase [Rhodovarius lipocyclicus]